jgi:class 3 adenylate cyclase
MPPQTKYACTADGVHLAYQVVGEGPIDLLYIPTWISQVEHLWEEPRIARFFARMASFARLILFDRRGCGLSDPVVTAPTLEEQMDDIAAVLDAAGSERAGLFATLEAGPMAMLYAATNPDRVTGLVLYSTFARATAAPGYDWTFTAEERAAHLEEVLARWGDGTTFAALAPSRAKDRTMMEWFARLQRLAGSPSVARQMLTMAGRSDVRDILPTIRVPTLVLHRRGDSMMDIRHSRYLAEHIPGARYVELEGTDNLIAAEDPTSLLEELEEFLTGVRPSHEPDRVLATVLFTDLVGSTNVAAELGDRRWTQLLGDHYAAVRRELDRFSGREVKTVGDGFLATFDGPARGIRAARAIVGSVSGLGLELRAGLHTGEVEVMGDDVGGMAVHIGARVMSRAGPNEVLVSNTVKDLVVGSGFEFEDRGATELKGVPGEWRLWAVGA